LTLNNATLYYDAFNDNLIFFNRENFDMSIKQGLSLTIAPLLLAFTSSVMADSEHQHWTDEGYVIHYNAVNTGFLEPNIAAQYKITRSKKQGMLNVSVRKGEKSKPFHTQPVKAIVTAQALNLPAQLKGIDMVEVPDGDATYYIGLFGFYNAEKFTFSITVQPEMQDKKHTITFEQEFFVDN
jgi:hypothetical protein